MKNKYKNKAILQPDECKVSFTIFDAVDPDWEDVIQSHGWRPPFADKKPPKKKKKPTDPWAELRERNKRK